MPTRYGEEPIFLLSGQLKLIWVGDLLIRSLPHDPCFIYIAVITDHHDAEEQIGSVFKSQWSGILSEQQGLMPDLGGRTSVPVEDDKVGFFAGIEVADAFVKVEGFGTAKRDRPEGPIGRELVALSFSQVLFEGIDAAVEQGVVAHADFVGFVQRVEQAKAVASADV